MRGTRWYLSLMAVCLTLATAGGLAQAADVGQPAPALAAAELDGHDFNLAALRGKVVIVNFWATWCEPCRQEMPALDAFYRQYHNQGVDMIGISADRPRDRSDVSKVAKTIAYPVAMLRDTTQNGFGMPGSLPTTYVIDTSGVVRAEMTPDKTLVTKQSLDATVLPLLPR